MQLLTLARILRRVHQCKTTADCYAGGSGHVYVRSDSVGCRRVRGIAHDDAVSNWEDVLVEGVIDQITVVCRGERAANSVN